MKHLDEFEFTFVQEAQGESKEKQYDFVVSFSHHCFTFAPNKHAGETLADYPDELYYSDSNETRVFCFSRYELSKSLPDIVKGIHQAPCFHTGKGNFFIIRMKKGGDKEGEYEIYFKVSRSSNNKLRLYVESAYIRDADHGSSQPPKKKINFFVIAHNTKMNKSIRVPK